eukprot:4498306-Amphidinium_carterae.1
MLRGPLAGDAGFGSSFAVSIPIVVALAARQQSDRRAGFLPAQAILAYTIVQMLRSAEAAPYELVPRQNKNHAMLTLPLWVARAPRHWSNMGYIAKLLAP